LPFDAVDPVVNVREKKTTKAEKKEKRKSDRKARYSQGVYSTAHDLYMNDELLPAVTDALTEVVEHRRSTAHEIDDIEKEVDRLNIQRFANAPIDTEEVGELVVRNRTALAAMRNSDNRTKVRDLLQSMDRKISAKENTFKPNTIKEFKDLKKIFG